MPLANIACTMQQECSKECADETAGPTSATFELVNNKMTNNNSNTNNSSNHNNHLLDSSLDLSSIASLPDSSAVQSRVAGSTSSQVDVSYLTSMSQDLIQNFLNLGGQTGYQNDSKRLETQQQFAQQMQQQMRQQQNQQQIFNQNFQQQQQQQQQHQPMSHFQQNFQHQQHQGSLLDQFIPGTISNRTLEQLTESTLRSGRPIKGELRFDLTSTPGTIGDRLTSAPPHTPVNLGPMLGLTPGNHQATSLLDLLNRTISPSDSDTSGVSSASDLSEATIVELMNSLQLNQSNPYGSYPVMTPPPGAVGSHGGFGGGGGQSPSLDVLRSLGLQSDIPLQRAFNGGGGQLYNDFSMSADLFASRPWTSLNTLFSTNATDPNSIDRAAKLYRNAATISEPTCTWSGQLPVKNHRNPVYSVKVFLGGVPWDISEVGLQSCFRNFGSLKIEWPGKDGKHPRFPNKGREFPVGYVYILFESERSVRSLLQACTHDFTNGAEYYFKISSKRMRSKEVQVIPWVISDSNYVKNPSQRLDPQKTVFVGALHGMLNAEGLANIVNDLFGNVVYAGIDTDKYKYPIGSGRVTFNSTKSYMKAVTAAFVEIKTAKFTKKIQIDPYLEESPCSVCLAELGPYFCRDFNCFRYYCRACWQTGHASEAMRYHKPLMRNNKASGCGYPVIEAPNLMI